MIFWDVVSPSLLHLLKPFPPLSHHVFIHCSLLWSQFICVRGRHKEGAGIFLSFFSGSVFSYCSWNKKCKSWLSLISSSLPTSALFKRFCGVLSQLNSAHSFFLFKKIIFFLAAKYNIDFEGGSVKLETLTWNSWFLIYTDTYFYF